MCCNTAHVCFYFVVYLKYKTMTPHKYSYQGIYDLCREHFKDILKRKPLQSVLDFKRVRFVNPRGRFDYCCFGDFYFSSGNVMMLITKDLTYSKYHRPDQMSNKLWSTVPMIFAGVETGVKDDAGHDIFTYDYCDYGMYRLMVQYLSFEEPCLLADNHSVPLSWAKKHGGLIKSGTTLYDLRKEMFELFDSREIWRVNQYNDPSEREKAQGAMKKPLFIDDLPEPNKKWPRYYHNINKVMNDNAVLVYFRSDSREFYVDEEGKEHNDYIYFIDNYPKKEVKETHEMIVKGDNERKLVWDMMLKAHRNPEKCFVVCDFFKDLVIDDYFRRKYAEYFKPLIEYHIQNVIIPQWIHDEWINEIVY